MRKMNKKGTIDIGAWIVSIFTNVWLYVVLAVMLITGIGARFLRKLRLRKNTLWLIAIVGFLIAFFGVGIFGVGTATLSSASSGITIDRIQTVTAYAFNDSVTTTDSGVDDTKMSDFYINEDDIAGDSQIAFGTFLVTRSGDLSANSCKVRVIKPASYDIADTTYRIVTEDANTGVMDAYVYASATSGTANGDEPKETNMLPFAEGVSVGYVAFNITLDETGFDPLTQYDYKDIRVDICGYPYVFRVHKNDA